MATVPSGFVKKPRPRSVAEAVSQNPHDRLKYIAKSSLQSYISSFLDTSGVNRSFVTASSPQGVTFVTDKSLQDSVDPSLRPTQLASMYNEIRQQPTSILLVDSGFQWVPAGLNGGLEAASNVNGKWQGFYRLFGRVPLTVAVVTQDQGSTDTLLNILLLIFSTFRNISGGSALHSSNPADVWEVRLPQTFTIGTTTPQEYQGDPTGRFWSASIDVVLDVEDQIGIETDLLSADVRGGVINSFDLASQQGPVITAPATVSLTGGMFPVYVSNYNPLLHRIVVDNPDIATLELGNPIYVTPHRLGSFNLKVFGNRLSGSQNPQAPATYLELSTAEVKVIF